MKIKKSVLRQIIKEELQNILKLVTDFADMDKFAKEKSYHDDECCDDENLMAGDMNQPMLGMGGGKRKQPSDYLSGGSNENSVSDHIMMGMDNDCNDNLESGMPDIVVRWQQLAESKRR
jgi:hypothetical protein